ncbi:hypothetical protein H5410_020656 [Solanum commersonii]|uniref:Uncharacterized protein n=1 Tax=Solanum commersonii TaxID=4109 RepID=A0A9J5ZBS0_SOLCO|nr:hypothetical protein H5410_020656 [Solanum commersonii]
MKLLLMKIKLWDNVVKQSQMRSIKNVFEGTIRFAYLWSCHMM